MKPAQLSGLYSRLRLANDIIKVIELLSPAPLFGNNRLDIKLGSPEGVGMSSEKVIYPKIYMVHSKPSSECEFFEVKEAEGYYHARCRVLERPLPAPVIEKCERFWESCPFRRLALRFESSE